jgi:hypothetical protein
MNVIVKRNLIIFKEPYQWYHIKRQIEEDFGDKVFLISWRAKKELGFSVRYHKGLNPITHSYDPSYEPSLAGRYRYTDEVHLDFYNESALSWFCLKYVNTESISNDS